MILNSVTGPVSPAQIAEKEGHTECAELIRRLEDMLINKPEPVFDPKDFK